MNFGRSREKSEKNVQNLLWGCIAVAAAYWTLDAILETYLLPSAWPKGESFFDSLFFPDLRELVHRLVVISGFLLAGLFALAVIRRQHSYEEKLQEETDFVNAVLDAAPALIVVVDKEGKLVRFNKTCEKALGYSEEEIRGKRIWDLFVETDDNKMLKTIFENLSIDTPPEKKVSHWRKRNGEKVLISWSNAVIRGKSGAIKYIIGTGVNITERKKVEERLEVSAEEIKQFAYSVVHDLKSPTIGLYGIANLLNRNFREMLPEKAQQYIDQIMETAKAISALVEQVNIFISTREIPIDIETIKLREIVRLIRDEFAPRLSVRQVKLIDPDKFPEIQGDRVGILRVLRNLVDNALKYGGENLTEIRLQYFDNGHTHILAVSDNGVGIGLENPDSIFGMFKRHETSKGTTGSGIGLAIVKEIAKQHGGNVWIESKPGEGTTFFLSLLKDPKGASPQNICESACAPETAN